MCGPALIMPRSRNGEDLLSTENKGPGNMLSSFFFVYTIKTWQRRLTAAQSLSLLHSVLTSCWSSVDSWFLPRWKWHPLPSSLLLHHVILLHSYVTQCSTSTCTEYKLITAGNQHFHPPLWSLLSPLPGTHSFKQSSNQTDLFQPSFPLILPFG